VVEVHLDVLSLNFVGYLVPPDGLIEHNFVLYGLSLVNFFQQLILSSDLEIHHVSRMHLAILRLLYMIFVFGVYFVYVTTWLYTTVHTFQQSNGSRLVQVELESLEGVIKHQ